MFEEKTFESIRESILAAVDNDMAKVEGSYTSDLITAASLEIAKVYAYLNTLLSAMFPNAGSGEYLHRRAADFGLTPKAATAATAVISVECTAATTIPAGTLLAADGVGVGFKTINTVSIAAGSRATNIPIEATSTGPVNIAANTLYFKPAITGCTVSHAAFASGSNAETDEELYQRLKLRLQQPPASGSASDYKRWALEVPGIAYAKVRKVQNTGHIRVVIADTNCGTPSAALVTATAAHIEESRPLGAVVDVVGATMQQLSISASIKLSEGGDIESIRELFSDAVDEYIRSIAFNDDEDTLTLARVTHMLMGIPGVADVDSILINNAAQNWTINTDSIPHVQSLTITEANDE